jgi:penicillin-binding protein 1A
VPDVTKLAFLAAEDAYFYEHGGINYLALARALWANVRAGKKVQGGSTITQQVAEDVLLGHSRAFSQKVREWILAHRIERELSKDEILGLYLNNISSGMAAMDG